MVDGTGGACGHWAKAPCDVTFVKVWPVACLFPNVRKHLLLRRTVSRGVIGFLIH